MIKKAGVRQELLLSCWWMVIVEASAEAKAEIAADFTELIFANENTLRTFVEANSKSAEGRNMLQRLADAIRRFIANLKKPRCR